MTWLTDINKEKLDRLLGAPDATGLGKPQPCLFFACRARHISAIRALVDAKANCCYYWCTDDNEFQSYSAGTQPEEAHSSLLSLVCSGPEHRAVAHLLRGGAKSNFFSPIFHAAKFGNLRSVELLVKAGASVNEPYGDITALMQAALLGHVEICSYLLRNEASPNLSTPGETTALYFAAQNGHAETCEVLIKGGADVNKIERENKIAPLYVAAAHGHLSAVRVLIKHGANLDNQRDNHSTALYIAAERGHFEVLRELVKAGAGLNYRRNDGATAYSAALELEDSACLDLLIEAGASPIQHLLGMN